MKMGKNVPYETAQSFLSATGRAVIVPPNGSKQVNGRLHGRNFISSSAAAPAARREQVQMN